MSEKQIDALKRRMASLETNLALTQVGIGVALFLVTLSLIIAD